MLLEFNDGMLIANNKPLLRHPRINFDLSKKLARVKFTMAETNKSFDLALGWKLEGVKNILGFIPVFNSSSTDHLSHNSISICINGKELTDNVIFNLKVGYNIKEKKWYVVNNDVSVEVVSVNDFVSSLILIINKSR